MTLLIDVGNTRIKVGSSQSNLTLAVTHNHLEHILAWLQYQSLTPQKALGICVSSTDIKQKVERLLLNINCSVQWLDATLPCRLIKNNYEDPKRLGADRWLALIGVLHQQHHKNRPIVHASFGTATTVDTIMPPSGTVPKAQFVGGLILPGPKLMHDSLAQNTAQLSTDSGAIQHFPTNTQAAISSGIGAAQAGAVLRQWHLAYLEHQSRPLLVCSGGGWELIEQAVRQSYTQQQELLQLTAEALFWQPTPVLDGLNYISTQKS